MGVVLGAIWWVVALPFRLVFRAVELLGRLTALILGFLLMVLGVALGAAAIPVLGVPIFVIGLVITIRSLD